MILVVGATGMLGTEICRGLTGAGHAVRALVRSASHPAKVAMLQSMGCRLSTGDLKHPDSLKPACQGATAVISTASSTLSRQHGDSIETVDSAGQLGLVEAARQAGVGRSVLVSFAIIPRFNMR